MSRVREKEEIKKFVALPRLTPLQTDAYGHPCKRASLSDHPHLSGLPIGRRKSTKSKWLPLAVQNEPPWRLRTITADLWGAYPLAYCLPGRCLVVGHIAEGVAHRGFMSRVREKEIKKFVAFPGLAPLQPDAYAQPCKRASLSDHPHLSGLPTGRRKSTKSK